MNLASETMSKGDFAAHIGVSPGRVSQYIAEGKIRGDALEGEGRRARIRTAIAIEQIQRTLDPNQRFGANGTALRVLPTQAGAGPVNAKLPFAEPQRPASAEPPGRQFSPPVDELAELRLRQERVKAERLEREDLLDVGKYMLTDDVRREMAKAIASAYAVMEQGLQDMSGVLAEQFGIPQRDVLHALVKAFRSVRESATAAFNAKVDDLPEHVEDPGP